ICITLPKTQQFFIHFVKLVSIVHGRVPVGILPVGSRAVSPAAAGAGALGAAGGGTGGHLVLVLRLGGVDHVLGRRVGAAGAGVALVHLVLVGGRVAGAVDLGPLDGRDDA